MALEEENIVLNKDNGIDIEGATIDGTAFSAKGIEPKLQGAEAPGGAGTASAGSPGVSEPGEPSESGAAAVAADPAVLGT